MLRPEVFIAQYFREITAPECVVRNVKQGLVADQSTLRPELGLTHAQCLFGSGQSFK